MSNSLFISFEGPEGSGKSHQVRVLKERLQALGREVVQVRVPGGTPLCEEIRGLLQHDTADDEPTPRAETMLFYAAQAQLSERVIRPALERGCVVISDRYIDSATAYQGYARLREPDTVREMGQFVVNGLMPDKTLLLDLDVGVGFSRLTEKLDRMERAGTAFHERVRAAYLDMATREPERFAVIDGARSMDDVSKAVWEAVSSFV